MSKRRSMMAVVALLSFGVIAACTKQESSEPPSATTATAEPFAELRIGYLPIAECAHLYVAISKRYFDEERLSVQLRPMKGGATILPAVQQGDLDIGFTNVVSLIALDARLRPEDPKFLKSICCSSYERPDHLNHALLVLPSSRLTPRDLAKAETRIALNTTQNIEELMLRRYLTKKSIPNGQLNLRQISFPEMPRALREREVDVISAVEPFIEPLVQRGDARVLARQYIDVAPNTLVATYAASNEWSSENADVLRRFHQAMAKADTFIRANTAETRQIVGTFTRIKPEELAIIGLPAFELATQLTALQSTADEMVRYQFVKRAPPIKSMIWEP